MFPWKNKGLKKNITYKVWNALYNYVLHTKHKAFINVNNPLSTMKPAIPIIPNPIPANNIENNYIQIKDKILPPIPNLISLDNDNIIINNNNINNNGNNNINNTNNNHQNNNNNNIHNNTNNTINNYTHINNNNNNINNINNSNQHNNNNNNNNTNNNYNNYNNNNIINDLDSDPDMDMNADPIPKP